MKKFIVFLMLVVLSMPVLADVVIGNWEDSNDGWIDWGNKLSITAPENSSRYAFSSVRGNTLGSKSLLVGNITGWAQTLAIQLNYQQRLDFMANDQFSVDVTCRPGAAEDSGWNEVYAFTINAEGYGWNDQLPKPALHFDYWNDSPVRTVTLTWDYSATKAAMPEIPGWVELIFATNSDGVKTTLYFDNARLSTIPEPATLALLSLGLTLLRKRS